MICQIILDNLTIWPSCLGHGFFNTRGANLASVEHTSFSEKVKEMFPAMNIFVRGLNEEQMQSFAESAR